MSTNWRETILATSFAGTAVEFLDSMKAWAGFVGLGRGGRAVMAWVFS